MKPPKATTLVKDGVVAAGGTGITTVFWTGEYWKKTIYVKVSKDADVYIKGGVDADEMYHIKSGYLSGGAALDDTDYKWEPNAESNCFEIDVHLAYMQVIVDNMDGGNANTITIGISGVGE